MAKNTYGMTRGQQNKLKYIRNYERNKYYNGYGKTFKDFNFRLLPEIYDEFNEICTKLNVSKKELILKELEVLNNE